MVIRIPLLNVPVQGILPRQQILVEVITNLPYSCGGCPPFIQQHHDRSGTPFPRGPDDGCVLKLQHNDMHVTPISTSSSNNRSTSTTPLPYLVLVVDFGSSVQEQLHNRRVPFLRGKEKRSPPMLQHVITHRYMSLHT